MNQYCYIYSVCYWQCIVLCSYCTCESAWICAVRILQRSVHVLLLITHLQHCQRLVVHPGQFLPFWIWHCTSVFEGPDILEDHIAFILKSHSPRLWRWKTLQSFLDENAVAQRLRHYTTSQQVMSLITDGVIGIFQWYNPSGRTMALGSTQPLTEMSTRCISWRGKGSGCVRLTTFPPSCAVVMKSGNLNFLEPSRPLQACNGTAFAFYHMSHVKIVY